jgi:hypothetical protein
MATGAELTYNTAATAVQMANAIFGDGVTVTGATYTGATASKAIYTNGQLSPGVTPGTTGVILSTGNAADFTQSSGDPNRNAGTSTDTTGTNGNAQFNAIAGTSTFDASWLNVDFIPTGNVLTMKFVISSEEYPEYVTQTYNDVVGVWINGTHVPISVGTGVSGVTNLNGATQPNLYVSNNTGDLYNTEMDGFTITLSLVIPVKAGVVNSIRIGVADAGDAQYDTNLLIAGDSVQSVLVARDDAVTMTTRESETIKVLLNDYKAAGTLTITHLNGVAVVAGQIVTLPSGQQVKLNADGTITIVGNGDTEKQSFTYTVTDGLGHSSNAIVTFNSIPCFVAGTMIRTEHGEKPVEEIRAGDLVYTHDDGLQPIRWVGRKTVSAEGALAPIRIKAGTFGPHGTLMVSPQHRVLVRDVLAELLFGEAEVLVAAKDLVNDRTVRVRRGGEVDYVHLLFDRHQIVFSQGLATESFLPGPQMSSILEQSSADEIFAIFPELDPESGAGYSASARRALKPFEAQVLFSAGRKAA